MKVWLTIILVHWGQGYLLIQYPTQEACEAALPETKTLYADTRLYQIEHECIEGIDLKKKGDQRTWYEPK